jgi:hypothetical protein
MLTLRLSQAQNLLKVTYLYVLAIGSNPDKQSPDTHLQVECGASRIGAKKILLR